MLPSISVSGKENGRPAAGQGQQAGLVWMTSPGQAGSLRSRFGHPTEVLGVPHTPPHVPCKAAQQPSCAPAGGHR